ncbi:MAG: zf-TFIIB domain-containing protein [Deltaproteobacteria bacterium]|nr:zf-TFIIB domain-containing protein [Deltaproteobacteria bacterium]
MKCPVCSKQLVEFKAGSLALDICRDGCSGIWFDAAELDKCDEMTEHFPEELLRVNKNPNVVIDRSKIRQCPKCSVNMSRITLDTERRFEIDHCPSCAGQWLDNGELGRMRQVSKDNAEREANLAIFKKRINEQIQGNDARSRMTSFLKSVMY